MDWGSLGEQVAKIGLPLLGAILPIPGGAAIGAALASHIGAASAEPIDIFKTLTASADAVAKAQEFQATHQETILKTLLEFQSKTQDSVNKDIDSARSLAETEINKGGVFPSFISALVRPAWGVGALVIVGHSAWSGTPIDPSIKDVVMTVLEFYFGGKIIEAITPHVTEAISRFASK